MRWYNRNMTRQATIPPPARKAHNSRMTYEEFLGTDLDHPHYEWVDGRAVEMAPIAGDHSDIAGFCFRLLSDWVEEKDLGIVRAEPFQLKPSGTLPGRSPDVQVILKPYGERLKRLYTDGPADVVVEVASPSTRHIDRQAKFAEYEAGGVREYWMIDPMRKQAEFFVLDNGRYRLADIDKDNRFHSLVLPGLWIDVEWFWDRPNLMAVLKQLGLIQ